MAPLYHEPPAARRPEARPREREREDAPRG
jgi:hypothetical protein